MPKRKNDAFDVGTPADHQQWTADWCRDIDDAFTARESVIGANGLIAENDWFFEQGKGSSVAKAWVDGADLTSPIITETVETMQSQLLGAVTKAEPFCTVDGWGQDAKKAPRVEAFHEWKVDETGLKEELGKVLLGALLEDAYILEVRERIETRKLVEEINVAIETQDGGAVFTTDGSPALKFNEGEPVMAQPGEASAKVRRTSMRTKLLGPEYDAISMKNFVFLPGHAKNQSECYGYAYRIWSRVPLLKEKALDGVYDKTAVDSLGDSSDRENDANIPPVVDSVAAQYGPSVEKELFQLAINQDLDGDGRQEWYIATIHLQSRTLLRLKLDTFVMEVGKPRCVPFVLFPRRDSVYGYCFADKMKTSAWEDTALRNMIADRSALATNAPILVTQGSTWDPDTQPLGVGRVITGLRSPNEISGMQLPDVPMSAINLRQDVWRIKERVSGLADAAVGVLSEQQRTLGENQLAAAGSSKRVEYPLGHFRRSIQHVMELSQAIWVRALDGMPKGMDAPTDVVDRMQIAGGEEFDGRVTADMIRGKFRFKPFGSVDTADSSVQITYFTQGLIALGNIGKMSPMAMQILNDPDVLMRVLQEWGRVYKVRDVNVFLKAFLKLQQQPPMMPGMGMGGPPMGPPGLPMGTPHGGPPPQLLEALQHLSGGGPHVN